MRRIAGSHRCAAKCGAPAAGATYYHQAEIISKSESNHDRPIDL